MKYAIIIPDGCADEPQASLGGRTPLQAANVPNMDAIAAAGVVGRANHVPPTLPAGSDVANLSLLGYNPLEHFTGRAPLEAVSVAEVKGMGKQKSYLDRYADTEYARTFLPKVEITVWVDDLRAEDVARKIVEVARTGRMGDGKIFILPAEPYEAVVELAK